jgi:hypothetical protein
MEPPRPRISRETRLLLATVFVSVAALWALSRIRFPERPAPANPVTPLLTQLAAPAGFEELAAEIARGASRLAPSLVLVGPSPAPLVGLRVGPDVAAVLVAPYRPDEQPPAVPDLVARDPASGLAIARVPEATVSPPPAWTPARLDMPRYLVAAYASPGGPALRPVFVGWLQPSASRAWASAIWLLPPRTDAAPGDFLFTTEGALAGLVIDHAGAPALVPGEVVLGAAERLRLHPPPPPGRLGVEVQALTPALASATGARAGVVVVHVDPEGPAAGRLAIGDVVEAAAGEPIASTEDWRARVARLPAGASVGLRVRRAGKPIEVTLATAAPRAAAPETTPALGLTLRSVAGAGALVLEVAPGSAGARAGLAEGDLITRLGDRERPTAGDVLRAFRAAAAGESLLVAYTRAGSPRVTALVKSE